MIKKQLTESQIKFIEEEMNKKDSSKAKEHGIKLIRFHFGCSLKEATDLLEDFSY